MAWPFTGCGTYQADKQYNLYDAVYHPVTREVFQYINSAAGTGKPLPVEPSTSTEYWMKWGEPGTAEYDAIDQRLTALGFSALSLKMADLLTRINDLMTRTNDLMTRINERCDYGVVTGLVVAAQTDADMTVKVSAGTVYMANGDRFTPSAVAVVEVDEADETNGRVDIVYINSAGAVAYLAGEPAAEPAAPATPSGGLVLAEIAVAAQATTVAAENITDKRKIILA